MPPVFLVLNAGSSSLKFQVFGVGETDEPRRIYRGLFDGLGGTSRFSVKDHNDLVAAEANWDGSVRFGHEDALVHLSTWLRQHKGDYSLVAVGHRVVHGGMHLSQPVVVDQHVLRSLEQRQLPRRY